MTDYLQYYHDKCSKRELWLQFCPECQKSIFYPRGHCPVCLKSNLAWKQASGLGTLYTYTIIHVSALPEFSEQVPYVYGLVDLAEGVRIASNIIDCPLSLIKADMPVQMSWIERDGRNMPVFKPAW